MIKSHRVPSNKPRAPAPEDAIGWLAFTQSPRMPNNPEDLTEGDHISVVTIHGTYAQMIIGGGPGKVHVDEHGYVMYNEVDNEDN